MLRFSCVFVGWTRYCCWCIAVYFKFLAWKALHSPCIMHVVDFQRSDGSIVFAKILGPSERGADYRSITYERSGTVVTHDCAPVARMSFLRVRTPPRPTSPPTTANRCEALRLPQPLRSVCGSRALVFALLFCVPHLLSSNRGGGGGRENHHPQPLTGQGGWGVHTAPCHHCRKRSLRKLSCPSKSTSRCPAAPSILTSSAPSAASSNGPAPSGPHFPRPSNALEVHRSWGDWCSS